MPQQYMPSFKILSWFGFIGCIYWLFQNWIEKRYRVYGWKNNDFAFAVKHQRFKKIKLYAVGGSILYIVFKMVYDNKFIFFSKSFSLVRFPFWSGFPVIATVRNIDEVCNKYSSFILYFTILNFIFYNAEFSRTGKTNNKEQFV